MTRQGPAGTMMSVAGGIKRDVSIGPARLILGDCYDVTPGLDRAAGGPLTPGEWACITDPPYEFDASGGGKMRAARKYLDMIEAAELADGFDDSILTPALFAAVFVFCHNDQIGDLLPRLKRRFGQAALLGWHKTNPPPFRNKNYLPDLEFWVHAWPKGEAAGGYPVGAHDDMRRIVTMQIEKNAFDHPTVKPLGLMRRIVRNAQKPGIFDPFMGSGTTGVAAIMERRRFIGVERSAQYFDIAVARLTAAVKEAGEAAVEAACGNMGSAD